MLLITRKQGEAIMIGDDVVIRVLEIHRGCIRLGFDAPRWIGIRRVEKGLKNDSAAESPELCMSAAPGE